MSIKPKSLEPRERIKNFQEVNLGYDEEEAGAESSRCLQCQHALCVIACPLAINIPKFIKFIKTKKFKDASYEIQKTNPFPSICGRVCPQENLCEKYCILAKKQQSIAIGLLERFAADKTEIDNPPKAKKNKYTVAIVGSGPAGLAAAHDLAIKGYTVTIFEALSKPGGVLTYGIPEFRLPKKIMHKAIDSIKSLGVTIKTNAVIGKLYSIEELEEKFDALFLACGAGLPSFLDIPGINLNNVYSANEFLTRINLMTAYQFPQYKTPIKKSSKTVVVGGGNVAIDVARVAKRLGSDVTVIYRRSFKEMKARKHEIENAQQEGVHFILLTHPVRILGTTAVEAVDCIQMMLSAPNKEGIRKPEPIEGSEFTILCDQIIIAIGQGPNSLITKTTKIEHDIKDHIIVDEHMHTSREKVFAGGDIIIGDITVIKAIHDGKKAAVAIDNYLNNKK